MFLVSGLAWSGAHTLDFVNHILNFMASQNLKPDKQYNIEIIYI